MIKHIQTVRKHCYTIIIWLYLPGTLERTAGRIRRDTRHGRQKICKVFGAWGIL